MTDVVTKTAVPPQLAGAANRLSPTQRMLKEAWTRTSFKVGLFVFVGLIAAALIYPEFSSTDPTKMNIRARFVPPLFLGENWSWAHPFGTDHLGRDLFLRCLIGLRWSVLIGCSSVIMMFAIGCGLGMYAGFKGNWTDTIIMRITDAQLSIPFIILAITILGVSRPTVPAIILVLGLSSWPLYARVARSVTLSEKGKEYIRAQRVLGATDWRILILFLAPAILPPIAFVAVLDVARMMIFEAILGFIGLGIQPPTPSFGSIIADGRKYLINAWWIATMPGVLLLVTLTSLNLMGAALEKARNDVLRGAA
ncbi:ABC transporter permease [Hoeflea prorocentri]|uniref:ABC transporter permease n=1 Tax=Hoeflea prorocentri TaxID=1922333 RepID=A0A9X3UDV6_9HYPH|nr:ABC transporter permease [Hoeflea prorocentri]MCY6379608.1 ABC transporter permease [Hoeflea prorocentri]MDA5397408.1 ABC transporter permease [Hoeflea prorocentri]